MNQDSKLMEAQDRDDDKTPDVQDGNNTPVQDSDTNPQSENEEDNSDIPDEQTS